MRRRARLGSDWLSRQRMAPVVHPDHRGGGRIEVTPELFENGPTGVLYLSRSFTGAWSTIRDRDNPGVRHTSQSASLCIVPSSTLRAYCGTRGRAAIYVAHAITVWSATAP